MEQDTGALFSAVVRFHDIDVRFPNNRIYSVVHPLVGNVLLNVSREISHGWWAVIVITYRVGRPLVPKVLFTFF